MDCVRQGQGQGSARLLGMPRLAVHIVLLLALLWQSVAMARIGSSVNVLADPAHAALHWHGEGHHHHDDGSYDADHPGDPGDASDAVRHVVLDSVGVSTALLAERVPAIPPAGSAFPEVEPAVRWPDRVLDGLLRPPRSQP